MKFEIFFDSEPKINREDVVITIKSKVGNGSSYFASNILNTLNHLRVKKAKVYELNSFLSNQVIITFKRPRNVKMVKNHINDKYYKYKLDNIEKKCLEFKEKIEEDKNSFKNVFERGFKKCKPL